MDILKRNQILKMRNSRLKKEIMELKAYTKECDQMEKIYGITPNRGFLFGKIRNLSDFDKWSQTSFWKCHSDIYEYRLESLDCFLLAADFEKSYTLLVYCEAAMRQESSTLLSISDPFAKTIAYIQDCKIDLEKIIGRMLLMTCKKTENEILVMQLKPLPYNTYGRIT